MTCHLGAGQIGDEFFDQVRSFMVGSWLRLGYTA
jgi:hypothetical protein